MQGAIQVLGFRLAPTFYSLKCRDAADIQSDK